MSHLLKSEPFCVCFTRMPSLISVTPYWTQTYKCTIKQTKSKLFRIQWLPESQLWDHSHLLLGQRHVLTRPEYYVHEVLGQNAVRTSECKFRLTRRLPIWALLVTTVRPLHVHVLFMVRLSCYVLFISRPPTRSYGVIDVCFAFVRSSWSSNRVHITTYLWTS